MSTARVIILESAPASMGSAYMQRVSPGQYRWSFKA
jgi:hypothetical protein